MPLPELMRAKQKKWYLAYCDEFDHLFEQFMHELLAEHDATRYHPWSLQTKAGELGLTCYDDWVPTRFEEPERARKFVDCNPYSGKRNFHTFWSQQKQKDGPTPQEFVDDIRRRLQAVLEINDDTSN